MKLAITVNDPSGLNAGNYYFKISAIDSNGEPAGGVLSDTILITVVKTSTSVAFSETAGNCPHNITVIYVFGIFIINLIFRCFCDFNIF
mgnify:CR=1 FL=1